MFDSCQPQDGQGGRCADVAEKLVQLFGWRQVYKVEKLQRSVPDRATTRISITRTCGSKDTRELKRKFSLDSSVRNADTWISVHTLQSSSGGILDPDDRLSSVCDDRETIFAVFDDTSPLHGGADGASGSSVGTGSPELGLYSRSDEQISPVGGFSHQRQDIENVGGLGGYPRTDIEVTGEQIASGVGGNGLKSLQVRRGSDGNLQMQSLGTDTGPGRPGLSDPSKRWSAAAVVVDSSDGGHSAHHQNMYLSPDEDLPESEEDTTPFLSINRDGSNRLSMQFLGDGGGYRWAEAAAKQRIGTSLPRDHRRKEPLGQANSTETDGTEMIVIRNEPGPLGIHVVPDYDRLGKDKGLLVQGIEPGGRIDRDGKLAVGDRIVEINGQNLLNTSFQRVQEMFKLSLIATELRLKVIKNRPSMDSISLRKPPAPVYPKTGLPGRFPEDKENVAMVEVEEQMSSNTKVATVSPTKKIPANSRNPKSLLTANTRKIGRKIDLELTKGLHGLGFSITTRDNPAGGNCPIYIKNILPKGAAVEDGRLKPGDRLLEVNNIEMTGKSQAEAVAVLRNALPGSKVKIVVSRQEDVTGPNLPREIGADGSETSPAPPLTTSHSPSPPAIPPLPVGIRNTPERVSGSAVAKIISQFQEAAKNQNPPEKLSPDDTLIFPWKHREILTFDIPVHDSEKAGLGVSVKGKTTSSNSNQSNSMDLGIFVKSVLHGGAASRDKRLRTNDQLLSVNGVSLLNQSNAEAMETLRKAMISTEGPVKGSITLTVARRAPSPGLGTRGNVSNLVISNSGPEITINNSAETDTSQENSGTSESSGNTVIFLPYKDSSSNSVNTSTNSNNSPIKNSYSNNWNPVIDRITGQNKNLRNESYYMATHDTWNTSMLINTINQDKLISPTVNLPSSETVIIEEDLQNVQNFEKRNETEPDGKASVSSSVCDKTDSKSSTDVTYASQLSLENPSGQGFSRDAFGRQSMSEKRHATLDAKSTGTYQRNKKLREEREKQKPKEGANLVRVGSVESIISLNRSPIHHPEYADKLGQLGPSLGMKKSSSLESLQTMVQEIQMQEEADPAYSYRGAHPSLKVIRGRGCDESFRAAVVDPDHRSETNAKKHWLLDPPEGEYGSQEREVDGFTNVRGGLRQSSLNAVLDGKKIGKKKPGILKGIGSMFRFGKHRKTDSGSSLENHLENPEPESEPPEMQPEPIQEIPEDQRFKRSIDPSNMPSNYTTNHQHQNQPSIISSDGITVVSANKYYIREENDRRNNENSVSRSEKVHQLRSRHQQRHQDRHGQYPNDDKEEHYEEVIRQRLEQPGPYDSYRQMRPGSRSGITEPMRLNHYVNYDELQHQLSTRKDQLSENQIVQMRMQVQQQRLKVEEESRKQHQYHSQRQPRSELQRPVSNFYEYESIQSLMLQNRGRPSNTSSSTQNNAQSPHKSAHNSSHESYNGAHSSSQQNAHNSGHNSTHNSDHNRGHNSEHNRVHNAHNSEHINRGHNSAHNSDVNSNSLPRHHQNAVHHQLSAQQRHYYSQQRIRAYNSSNPSYSRYVPSQHPARLRGPFVTHVTIGNDSGTKGSGSKV